MSNIKGITPDFDVNRINLPQNAEPQSTKETVQNPEETDKTDILQVNQQRRDAARIEENAKLLLNELPEIRPDKIERARHRLQQGFYDQDAILEKTAEKLQQDQSLKSNPDL